MSDFTVAELNSIREIVSAHILSSKKLNEYAEKCSDSKIKKMFADAAQEAQNSANNLISMI